MTYGDIKGQRVLLNDGTVLDVTGGFASGGSRWADRKLFGNLATDGTSIWSRGLCITQLLGETPERTFAYVVYRVSTDAREATEEDIYCSILAPSAHDAADLLRQVQGCDRHYTMGALWDHDVWGYEADGGFRYHLFPAFAH